MLPTTVVRGRKNPLHYKFAERLRRARKTAGMHASGLSEAAGLSQSLVGQLEAGPGLPRLPTAEKLARVLCLSPAWLAFGLENAAAVPTEGPLWCEGLAARAKEVRTTLGLSLREVDRRAGGTEGTTSAIERGTLPAIDTLEDLARALKVSPAWLAYGEGPRELLQRGAKPAQPTAPQQDLEKLG